MLDQDYELSDFFFLLMIEKNILIANIN